MAGIAAIGCRMKPAPGVQSGPPTRRGRNTRASLLDAARRVFERDGFLDAKITGITREAGVATGSFYTYFESKEEPFRILLEMVQDDFLYPDVGHSSDGADPAEAIRAATGSYFATYRKNAGLMRLFEQMAVMDDAFREARVRRAALFINRNARGIQRLQEAGRADPTIRPELASIALGSMVSRAAHLVFILRYDVEDVDELVDVLVRLWSRSLDIA